MQVTNVQADGTRAHEIDRHAERLRCHHRSTRTSNGDVDIVVLLALRCGSGFSFGLGRRFRGNDRFPPRLGEIESTQR
jgi:hypothetical protein